MATHSPRVLSLCAGGGGLDLGIRLAVPDARTVLYLERDVVEAGVLGKGIEAGTLDDAPIWSDLLTFDGRAWRGLVDCVAGGFPCQPHSYAGKRLGEFDERNLWPAVARLVFDIAPEIAFFENVPGISRYFWSDIRPDLQALGYEVAEGIFSAAEVGAPHLRERLYIMAYRNEPRLSVIAEPRPHSRRSDINNGDPELAIADDCARGEGLGDTLGDGRRSGAAGCSEPSRRAFPPGPSDATGWRDWLADWPGTEPSVRRDADGLASRADRLRVLGNGVVPVVAGHAWRTLSARLGIA